MPQFSPHFRLHLIVLLWGFTGVIGKLIQANSLPLVWYRVLISTLSIGVYLYYKKIPLRISYKKIVVLLGIGTFIGIHWWLFFEAIKQANVSIALTTLSTCALFTAFLEPLMLKRSLDYKELILGTIVVGCFIYLFKLETQYFYGIILGLSCSFFSALFSVCNARFFNTYSINSSVIMFYEFIGAWLLVSFMMLYNNSVSDLFLVTSDIGWLLILGVLLTAYPMIESVSLMKYISPYTLVLSVNLEPVYGIILAHFIFTDGSETMKPAFYCIVAVLISSILINSFFKKRVKIRLD